jgi:hypothetical protein
MFFSRALIFNDCRILPHTHPSLIPPERSTPNFKNIEREMERKGERKGGR